VIHTVIGRRTGDGLHIHTIGRGGSLALVEEEIPGLHRPYPRWRCRPLSCESISTGYAILYVVLGDDQRAERLAVRFARQILRRTDPRSWVLAADDVREWADIVEEVAARLSARQLRLYY
jgi:hypothetical protein